MPRPSLRIFGSLLRTPGATPLPRAATPAWEGLLWRRSFASKTSQIAVPRPSLRSYAPKPKANPFRPIQRPFHSTARQQSAKGSRAQGLTARLKKLSREYGWTAVGVYLALSILDFPFCFMLVRVVGTEKIGEIEHFIVSNLKKLVPQSLHDRWNEYKKALKDSEKEHLGNDDISEAVEAAGWGVEEAEARNKAEASLGTQLALAYAIHKSFIFVRVPLTAAILPKVVRVLRSWGGRSGSVGAAHDEGRGAREAASPFCWTSSRTQQQAVRCM